MKIKKFVDKFEEFIPNNISLSFDNVGLLIGDYNSEITGIYLCLDINENVIENVKKLNINTIISHHPIIFNPINKMVSYDLISRKIIKCVHYNINVLSYHTNLDAVVNGMNETIVKILDFDYTDMEILELNNLNNKYGIGRIINLKRTLNIEFIIKCIKEKFNIDILRFVDSGIKEVNKICIINGSGNSLIKKCLNRDIDLVITGDITYHIAFEAVENKLSLIDMGHFNSENMIFMKTMDYFIKQNIEDDIKIYFDCLLTDVYKYV